jgi:hypothetical protein
MADTASAVPLDGPNPGRRKGGARGALICFFFGSVWMFLAVVFSGRTAPAWFGIVGVIAAILISWALIRVRAARHLVSPERDLHHWRSFRKLFWIDSGVEWLSAAVAVNVLAHYHRLDLIPQVLGGIIGLHFLPLARIFRLPLYYVTGTVMVVGALGSFLVPAGGARNVAGCAVIGLTLWCTGVVGLFRDWRYARPIAAKSVVEKGRKERRRPLILRRVTVGRMRDLNCVDCANQIFIDRR